MGEETSLETIPVEIGGCRKIRRIKLKTREHRGVMIPSQKFANW